MEVGVAVGEAVGGDVGVGTDVGVGVGEGVAVGVGVCEGVGVSVGVGGRVGVGVGVEEAQAVMNSINIAVNRGTILKARLERS